jgi:hypothetical protein
VSGEMFLVEYSSWSILSAATKFASYLLGRQTGWSASSTKVSYEGQVRFQ